MNIYFVLYKYLRRQAFFVSPIISAAHFVTLSLAIAETCHLCPAKATIGEKCSRPWQMLLHVRANTSHNEHGRGHETFPAAHLQDTTFHYLSSPPHFIYWRCLFISLFACVWSKGLTKQQAVCQLCGKNDMEIIFMGHCVALKQPGLKWQYWSDWQWLEWNRLSWMICFRSKPGVSPARLGLICVWIAVCYSRVERAPFSRKPRQESVSLNWETSFSDLVGFIARQFHQAMVA